MSVEPLDETEKDMIISQEQNEQNDESEKASISPNESPSPKSPFSREAKFQQLLFQSPIIDTNALRRLAWNGIPDTLRGLVWQVLLGYLPPRRDRQEDARARRRLEYRELVEQHLDQSTTTATNSQRRRRDETIYHQVNFHDQVLSVRFPLMFQGHVQTLPFLGMKLSERRPASGYVQGINDLVCPFYQVFLSQHDHGGGDGDGEGNYHLLLSDQVLWEVEADSFWCFSRLVDTIQDNYTFSQSGLTRQIARMRSLVARTDPALVEHLEDRHGLQFVQFAFRWVNCLLMREFPLPLIIRMWDTYLSEPPGREGRYYEEKREERLEEKTTKKTPFSPTNDTVNGVAIGEFHPYVCAALLLRWSAHLRSLESQEEIFLFLQSPPTAGWSVGDVEMLLSEAWILKSLYHEAQGHFEQKGKQ